MREIIDDFRNHPLPDDQPLWIAGHKLSWILPFYQYGPLRIELPPHGCPPLWFQSHIGAPAHVLVLNRPDLVDHMPGFTRVRTFEEPHSALFVRTSPSG